MALIDLGRELPAAPIRKPKLRVSEMNSDLRRTQRQDVGIKSSKEGVEMEAAISLIIGALASSIVSTYFAPTLEVLAAATLGRFWRRGERNVRGLWEAVYDYPSNGKQAVCKEVMKFRQIGNNVYAHHIRGDGPHENELRLRFDGIYLTGTWVDVRRTAHYHGVVQLQVRASGSEIFGRWVGFNSDSTIEGGEWKFTRARK